jgi:polyhydroxybutyrate depolymerase
VSATGGTTPAGTGGSAPTGTGGSGAANTGGTPEGGVSEGGTDAPSHGPAVGDWKAGDYPPDINSANFLELTGVKGQGSYTRQYKVHVPPGYDSTVPTPVVFCIHGLGQNATLFCVTGAALDKKSDAAGFILVMPNGYQSSWNAGTCCGGASNEKLDDVALMRAIFAEVDRHLNVDHRRVYATGLSNGAYMSYRLACDAADIFAAVAPAAGAIGINTIGGGTNAASDFTTCDPKEPVSVLDTHGTADPLIPYSLQAPTLALITGKDGCSATTAPAIAPKSAGDTACITYAKCLAGIEVTACSITGGGHCWFGSPDCGTGGGAIGAAIVGANSKDMASTDAVWDFFARTAKKK